MPTAVLILAPADDVHAIAVKERIEQISDNRTTAVIADVRTFPTASTITWKCSQGRRLTAELVLSRGLPASVGAGSDARKFSHPKIALELDDIVSIWMRRPGDVGLDPRITVPEFRDYAAMAARASLNPVFSIRPTYNCPSAEARVQRKPLQLYYAGRSGFRTPRTLITSSPEEAIAFIAELSGEGRETVYKQVASTPDGPPTRLFLPADRKRMHDICLCPNLFQERICGGPDLRIMVIGNQVFACEWCRERDRPPLVDIRLDPRATMWPTHLPCDFSARLVELHKLFGLALGVYDFKVDAEGIPNFLEVNPGGQWLDLEADAGHPISWHVAKLLAAPETIDAEPPKPFTASDLRTLLAGSSN